MIDILLATYNSSAYLKQTFDSILQQDRTEWRLLISDGGSTDPTSEIIEQYVLKHPGKIIFLPSEKPLSASENFSRLLERSESDYVMFCDHDDVWFPDKISKTISTMKQSEQQHGTESPILVFTDMKVTDENLNVLSDSNFKYQNLNPLLTTFNRLLLQNVPSGCTMMMNRSLVDLSRPIPVQAAMHDHWVSLVAAAFGEVIFLDVPTVLYRQHGQNYYGASRYGWQHFHCRYKQGLDTVKSGFQRYIDQAITFYNCHEKSLQPQHRKILEELSQWPQLTWVGRRKILLKHRIFKTGFRRNLGMFLIV